MKSEETITTTPRSKSNSDPQKQNKRVVHGLYKALAKGDTNTIASLLAGDVEWWFHGPPRCQHMMRMLTSGESNDRTEFLFVPRTIDVIGERVIAEGWEGEAAYWVHAWIVKDGKITEIREYFNTWLTVKYLKPRSSWRVRHKSRTVWRSNPGDLWIRSLPTLLLTI
ncbi:hypothetical protein K2173_000138 [Erythroxylum novogranatense]|uniref:Wound-induced protein 1 n=1 Tax=Erythroxylum novogranatense TaxID=1862640 RepID=A0AAV8SPP7_9ROSI|nr:hypothetical protein K2173_000138 [Erythroxylum novogranatense]